MKSVIIIGGGITGLSAAWFYSSRFPDHKVTVIEKSRDLGGNMRSEVRNDFLFEYGPRGVLKSSHAFLHLVHLSGGWKKLKAGKKTSSVRFIWYNGKMHQLGGNPLKMLSNPELLRLIPSILKERKIPAGKASDESVAGFFERRFGSDLTRFLVDAFVTGVWAGDIHSLSVKSAFPSVWQAEQAGGSVTKGMRVTKDARRLSQQDVMNRFPHPDTGKTRFLSFEGGLQAFASHLAETGSFKLISGQEVTELFRDGNRWELSLTDGTVLSADSVVHTGSAGSAAKLVAPHQEDLAAALKSVPYAPVATVNLGYSVLPASVEGFGFLIPSSEKADILGIIYNSGTFSGVAPSAGGNFTVMIGGATKPEFCRFPEPDLIQLAVHSMNKYLGISHQPDETGIRIWKHAIPQYPVGHDELVESIRHKVAKFPGLSLIGNWSGGIGLNDCVSHAWQWAQSENP